MNELLDHVPVSATAKEAVLNRLQEPHRRYHDLEHVLEMWRWHREYSRGQFPDVMVASFCLYHDAIYQPGAKDNELRSADLWLRDAAGEYPLVSAAILGSADHFTAHREPCIDWCLNLDLLRLGTPNHEFTQHGLDIRAEYTHLTDHQWIKASSEFRAKVMAQSTIFRFKEFAVFERQARHNLAKALSEDWQALGYS